MTRKPKPKAWKCTKCDQEFEYSEPLIIDGMIGRSTPVHECGPGFTAVTLRPASASSKSFWNKVLEYFDL